jgi:hypothetical protein
MAPVTREIRRALEPRLSRGFTPNRFGCGPRAQCALTREF